MGKLKEGQGGGTKRLIKSAASRRQLRINEKKEGKENVQAVVKKNSFKKANQTLEPSIRINCSSGGGSGRGGVGGLGLSGGPPFASCIGLITHGPRTGSAHFRKQFSNEIPTLGVLGFFFLF